MLGTLATGCQTTKNESDSPDKVESQVESDKTVDIEEETSEIAEDADSNEESTEAEEAEYVPNPDNYTVYVINTQRFDNPEDLKSLGNLANQAVIKRGQAVTLYVLDFESLPGDTDNKIDSVKIIDKQTGSDVTDILGNYADSQRGNVVSVILVLMT